MTADPIGLPAGQAWADAIEEPAPVPPVDEDEVDVDFDFDEAWAEQRARREPPPKIRLCGEIYTLPHAMPAKLILFGTKAAAKSNARMTTAWHPNDVDTKAMNVTPAEVQELLGSILGTDNVERILLAGIDLEQLEDVLARCMQLYKRRQGKRAAPAMTGATEPTS